MDQKEHFFAKTTKFWPKSRKREFLSGIFFRHFLKDQKNSYYAKNQKNLKQRLGEMGQKEHFWPKTTKFWPKTAKKSKTRIFARNFFSPYFKRPKNQFLCQKSEKIKVAFGRNGPKRAFLTQNDQKFENKNFRPEFFFAIF